MWIRTIATIVVTLGLFPLAMLICPHLDTYWSLAVSFSFGVIAGRLVGDTREWLERRNLARRRRPSYGCPE